MKKQNTTASNGQITFDLTIKAEDIAKSYQAVLAKVALTAEIKGFRKGKAPIAMVEKSVDKSRLYAQVLDAVVPPAYAAEITKQKITPIIDPQITPKESEEGKDWVFTVTTVVKPEVELGDYRKYVSAALSAYKKTRTEISKDGAKSASGGSKQHEGHDHARDELYTVAFDALLKESQVEVAPLLIEQEAKRELSRLVKQLSDLKLSVADFAKSQKKTQEELVKEYETTATTNLKLEFILDKLIQIENPEIKDDEVKKLGAPAGQEAYAKYALQKQKVVDKLLEL